MRYKTAIFRCYRGCDFTCQWTHLVGRRFPPAIVVQRFVGGWPCRHGCFGSAATGSISRSCDLELLLPSVRDRVHSAFVLRVETNPGADFSRFRAQRCDRHRSLYRYGVQVRCFHRRAKRCTSCSWSASGRFLKRGRERSPDQTTWQITALAEPHPFELLKALGELGRRGPKCYGLLVSVMLGRSRVGPLLVGLEEEFGPSGV